MVTSESCAKSDVQLLTINSSDVTCKDTSYSITIAHFHADIHVAYLHPDIPSQHNYTVLHTPLLHRLVMWSSLW